MTVLVNIDQDLKYYAPAVKKDWLKQYELDFGGKIDFEMIEFPIP